MRTPTFPAQALESLFHEQTIVTLDQLRDALGDPARSTVFRKLGELEYLSSYSHRGRYYTLRSIARFSAQGLWSCRSVWFSRFGTLMDTAQALVTSSRTGYTAAELRAILHVKTKHALAQLVRSRRLSRESIGSVYVYFSSDSKGARRQQQRRLAQAGRSSAALIVTNPDLATEEAKAMILLFYSLLDEKQRRLYAGLESLKLGPRTIPVDADMAALVPYRGRQGSYRYVSASDVLQGKVEASVLRGAIVLVGTTAPGLLDLRTAPMQESYAGVEVHANMITSIIDQSIRARPAYTLGLELILLLLAGLMLALTLPLLSPLYATLLSLTTVAALLGLNLYFWQFSQLIVPLAAGLVLIAALFVLNMSYGFFVDARSKRMLAHLFGQYVPPELVDEMAQDPGAYSLEGSSRELTVLFSDVRGFTTISEGLDPKQLTQLMNEFLTPMTQVIHHHRGTIDKYMGDAIMAFWGAPVADPDHARHALLAGLEMIAKLESLQDHFKQKGWPPIRVGVGLNTGDMTVGNMGSEFRLAYTIMGDAVNLGSRLESLTRVYGGSMMVSEFTMARVPDFSFRELDCVRVKGKERPVKIYEPLGPADQVSAADQAELADYKQALAAYRSQQWVQAQAAFAALQQRNPQRLLYHLYQERIAQLVQNPPEPDWDGSYTFKTK